MDLSIGTLLRNGKYLLKQVLAQDGLLTAYLAIHTESNQPVVVKFLAKSLHSQPEFLELQKAFALEVRRFAPCQHPHLVKIRDLFIDRGLCFAVMDYVQGQSLGEIIRANGKLSEAGAVYYVRQVGSALIAMHKRGLLHRDVKPDHIIRQQGTNSVILTEGSLVHTLTPGMMQTYAGVVSVGYTAPEQTQVLVPDSISVDVYGLAASLYYLLTGQTPIAAALRDRIPLVNLRQFQPQLSDAVEQAILQGMEMDPQKRSPTIDRWLRVLLDNQPTPQSSSSVQPTNATNQATATAVTPPPVQPANQPTSPTQPDISETMPTSIPTLPNPTIPGSLSPQDQQPQPSPQSPAVIKPKSPAFWFKWWILTAIVAAGIGAGIGLSFRFGILKQSDGPALKPSQDFPPRPWPSL